MGRTYYQYPDAVFEFTGHADSVAVAVAGTTKSDVHSATVHKDLRSPAGGFEISLVPRQEYLRTIHGGAWVKVYINDGTKDGGPADKPWMIGIVDRARRVRRVVDQQKGTVEEVIHVTGRDFGKVLLGLQLVFDPVVEHPAALVKYLGALLDKWQGREAGFKPPGQVVKNFCKAYLQGRNQFVPPAGMPDLDYTSKVQDGRGKILYVSDPNLGGNLWTTLEQYSHPILNEMFVDTIEGVPTLVLREHPYDSDPFNALDAVELDTDELTDEDIGTSDNDVVNWFRIHPDIPGTEQLAATARIGVMNPASIRQHGLRRFERWSNAVGELDKLIEGADGGDTQAKGLLQEWCEVVAAWNWGNEFLLSGSLSSRMRSAARIGKRLDLSNSRTGENLSFYIEGVTQTFQYPSPGARTQFSVARGVGRPVMVRDSSGGKTKDKDVSKLLTAGFVQVSKEKVLSRVPDFTDSELAKLEEKTGTKSNDAGPAAEQSEKPASAPLTLSWPCTGPITSGYGARSSPTPGASTDHKGIDIGVPQGTPVTAAADGNVTLAADRGGPGGNEVVIAHAEGLGSGYSHLAEFIVDVGERVKRGQVIAYSGGEENTPGSGTSTGPHLHFSVTKGGSFVNPLSYLK